MTKGELRGRVKILVQENLALREQHQAEIMGLHAELRKIRAQRPTVRVHVSREKTGAEWVQDAGTFDLRTDELFTFRLPIFNDPDRFRDNEQLRLQIISWK